MTMCPCLSDQLGCNGGNVWPRCPSATPNRSNGAPTDGVAACVLSFPPDVHHNTDRYVVDLQLGDRSDRMGDHCGLDSTHGEFRRRDNWGAPHPPSNATAAFVATAGAGLA